MQPKPEQVKILKSVISIFEWQISTNDIYSPTHGSDNFYELMKLADDGILTEEQVQWLDVKIDDILNFIKFKQ